MPPGDRTCGSIPNVVSFICYFHIVLLTYNAASINSKFAIQHINLVRWLKDIVEGLGGTTPVVHLELVRQPDIKRVHISFQIPVRHIEWSSMVPRQDPSSMIPIVSIAVVDGEASIWTTYERLAVEAYLQQLKDHGYFVPTFHIFELSSYRREKAILF